MCRLRIPNGILKHWQFAGHGRSRRAAVRAVRPRHHPRQPAGSRNSAEACGGPDRGHSGPRPVLARLGRRQHPQRHGNADRRDRSAGIARHPRICPRMALSHPQRPLADGTAAKIQRRLRRRRQDRGARGYQRHRFRRGRGQGRVWRRTRRLVSAGDRRHHRPQGFCQADRHHRQAGGRDQNRRRHRPRVHRPRRPHQPAQSPPEIRHRRHGHGEVPRPWSRKNSATR